MPTPRVPKHFNQAKFNLLLYHHRTTLTAVAQALGITRQGLHAITLMQAPGYKHRTALATLLGTTADDLWMDSPPPPGPISPSRPRGRGWSRSAPILAAATVLRTAIQRALSLDPDGGSVCIGEGEHQISLRGRQILQHALEATADCWDPPRSPFATGRPALPGVPEMPV